eukprot:CAMPEP_0176016830 /NCGR_PEP_ID=MMETSP0120_2-20121206/8052_1 /TAXON_ID=160619 /ORGANISM="Kryptoperidinium foliaceum, Strain CCMP 1326" /LENGTH=269 /DNA_ID=CAMNT_0017349837 /DNA_START=1 /DNA_END=809 /DNA_ORIENTATION=-
MASVVAATWEAQLAAQRIVQAFSGSVSPDSGAVGSIRGSGVTSSSCSSRDGAASRSKYSCSSSSSAAASDGHSAGLTLASGGSATSSGQVWPPYRRRSRRPRRSTFEDACGDTEPFLDLPLWGDLTDLHNLHLTARRLLAGMGEDSSRTEAPSAGSAAEAGVLGFPRASPTAEQPRGVPQPMAAAAPILGSAAEEDTAEAIDIAQPPSFVDAMVQAESLPPSPPLDESPTGGGSAPPEERGGRGREPFLQHGAEMQQQLGELLELVRGL